MHAYYVKTAP